MSLFSKPKPKAPPKMPEPPTVDEAQERTQDLDAIRKRRGRKANILTGVGGDDTAPQTGSRNILGGM